MKRIIRLAEPDQLTHYRAANPASTWEKMRNDAVGRVAYDAVRARLLNGQGDLCAFCEIGLHDHDPLKCRVEHFHPKSDTSTAHNWALDWYNMVAVCMGGSQRYQQPPHALEPLPQNLSCDAYKDQMVNTKQPSECCEGWIIDSLQLPAFLNLFFLAKSTGRLQPDEKACAEISLPGNQHSSTHALVQHTINMLNLNCDRLCQARLSVIWDIERSKKRIRDRNIPADQALRELAEHYFRRRWPAFFTTIRFCLGAAAEQYLTDIGFQG